MDKDGRFTVENYNFAAPFSGFFPGIAGLYGKPIWAFYVNRAQCISSFGVRDKAGAIVEFQPANKAYSLTYTHGFRTFLKIRKNGRLYLYEPFSENNFYKTINMITINTAELLLWERNNVLGIEVKVRYFIIASEPFAALAREVTVINISKQTAEIELIDGLPFVYPYGLTERQTKDMTNTIPAWIEVVNLHKKEPFYKLKVAIADKPVVTGFDAGNFYLGYSFRNNSMNMIQPIVDPKIVFGITMDLRWPRRFFSDGQFEVPKDQITEGIIPSAMGYTKFKLQKGQRKDVYSLIGHTENIGQLKTVIKKVKDRKYFSKKIQDAVSWPRQLKENMLTHSSNREFDLYCENTFMDNALRGGFPVTLKGKNGKKIVLHLFSRKHGDVERDYNKFLLQPTYFSQGDGNYRDMCQNRRNDVWFNSDVADSNIVTFANLIQLDGYNPLVLKGVRFSFEKIPSELTAIIEFLKKPFTLGKLFNVVEKNNIKIKSDKLINLVLNSADKSVDAEFKEGYWIDHWTYIIDMLESYRTIYPDRYWNLFIDKKYTFYDSPAIVVPLKERIKINNGRIRQYESVVKDNEKIKLIAGRRKYPDKVRTKFGEGKIYKTTLLVKFLCIIANKAGSFDSFGAGIEMEADKPGWYDALNGLPGLFGSSACEVFELKRLILVVIDALKHIGKKSIKLPVELVWFLDDLKLKEEYREKTRYGISGDEQSVLVNNIIKRLSIILKSADKAIGKAYNPKNGLYHTYFVNEPISVNPLKFTHRALPLFLEAQVHALRLRPGKEKAKMLYEAVKKNGLYDKKLKMYKLNVSLKKESLEIGRTKVFTPGWLENESIWLHMEYKYLLELLRNDLYKEFFKDFRKVMIPFQDPVVLKRNNLENCSFIVSSAHPNKFLHGRGFLPRLTGATAEFIHIWLWMCAGKEPFFMDNKKTLNLRFQPILPGWLFAVSKNENLFSFHFLGSIMVTYHNPEKRDTFFIKPARIRFGNTEIKGNIIPAPYAERIRDRKIKQIDIYFK